MPGRPPSRSHRSDCAPIIALLIRVRGPASDVTEPTARCAAALLLDADCPLPPRLEMSGSAPACEKLMQIVHQRNPYSALLSRGPTSYCASDYYGETFNN